MYKFCYEMKCYEIMFPYMVGGVCSRAEEEEGGENETNKQAHSLVEVSHLNCIL